MLAVVGVFVCSRDLQRFLLGSRPVGDAILFSLGIFSSSDDGVYRLGLFSYRAAISSPEAPIIINNSVNRCKIDPDKRAVNQRIPGRTIYITGGTGLLVLFFFS